MIGKRILVGLTYLDQAGEVSSQIQMHGLIRSTEGHTLVFDRSDGSGDFCIPFDGSLEESDPELIYTLRGTGEKVTGVHYVSTFVIHEGADGDS